MTSDSGVKVLRVMKARDTRGICGYCGGPLIAGQQIALVDGDGWQHASPCVRKQQGSYWTDAYTPSAAERERRRAADTERAVEWLRQHGRRV